MVKWKIWMFNDVLVTSYKFIIISLESADDFSHKFCSHWKANSYKPSKLHQSSSMFSILWDLPHPKYEEDIWPDVCVIQLILQSWACRVSRLQTSVCVVSSLSLEVLQVRVWTWFFLIFKTLQFWFLALFFFSNSRMSGLS